MKGSASVSDQRAPAKTARAGGKPPLSPENNRVRPALETETALRARPRPADVPVVQAGVVVLAVPETVRHDSVRTDPYEC